LPVKPVVKNSAKLVVKIPVRVLVARQRVNWNVSPLVFPGVKIPARQIASKLVRVAAKIPASSLVQVAARVVVVNYPAPGVVREVVRVRAK